MSLDINADESLQALMDSLVGDIVDVNVDPNVNAMENILDIAGIYDQGVYS